MGNNNARKRNIKKYTSTFFSCLNKIKKEKKSKKERKKVKDSENCEEVIYSIDSSSISVVRVRALPPHKTRKKTSKTDCHRIDSHKRFKYSLYLTHLLSHTFIFPYIFFLYSFFLFFKKKIVS